MTTLYDPAKPSKAQLTKLAGGDNRLRHALSKLFDLVPSEFNLTGDRITANGVAIAALESFLFKVIQFKSADYEILPGDSGVVVDTAGGSIIITLSTAAGWTDQNKFIENAGTSAVSIEPQAGELISGVDVLLISPDDLNPLAYLKSTGSGFVMLSDRNSSSVVGANYWATKFGEQMTTKLGEKLVFKV